MLATYKDLCLDAVDAPRSARFWAAALGLAPGEDRGTTVPLTGPAPEHTVWVNAVPEAHTVKNRLHVDVHTGSVAELEALGARVLAEHPHWTVLADPDGGEFCAFVRAEPPLLRLYELVLDAHDPDAVAAWWAGLIGGEVVPEDGWSSVEGIPGAPFPYLVLSPTDEPKTVKNRVHLDVRTGDVDALVAHGATLLRRPTPEADWFVLADPEGNEFCAFTR